MENENNQPIPLGELGGKVTYNAVIKMEEDKLTVETSTAKDFLLFQLEMYKMQITAEPKIDKEDKHFLKLIDKSLKVLISKVEWLNLKKVNLEKRGIEFKFNQIAGTKYIEGEIEEVLLTEGYPIPFLARQLLYPVVKKEEEQKRKYNRIAIHTVSQFYGDNKQLTAFSDAKIENFKKATGLTLINRPDSYGVVLNQAQRRVLEGILKAFTDTDYKGNWAIDKNSYPEKEHPVNKITGAYSNVDKIPVIELTQAELIKLSGYDSVQGDKVDVVEALRFLGTKQFCFYWLRLKTDEKGKPVKDKRGDFVKEEVMEVGSLFRVKYVRTEGGELKYYEIHPSAPVLDQVNSYFLLVPNNWEEEVKELTGKRASSYTYQFLLWLRLQYEHIRRFNKTGGNKRKARPLEINKSWEEIAIALKMPETMYKANRKRASKMIQEAYTVAIKLGYLVKVENNGIIDTLFLNEKYYPAPGELK
jgi:hypothetical protein